MLSQLQKEIELMPQNEAQKLIETLFSPTDASMQNLKKAVAIAPIKAEQEVIRARAIQEELAIKSRKNGNVEFNDYCDISDYDEVFSSTYEQECLNNEINSALFVNLSPLQTELSNHLTKKK